jgi:hypothetical protein
MRHPRRTTRTIGKATAIGTLAVVGGYLTSTLTASATGAATAVAPAAAAQAAPASGFVPIPSYRAYDSRLDPDESGKIFLEEQRFVDVALDIDGSERIPDEATAVAFNVTVTQTQGAGYVQMSPPGTAFGDTSTVNWTGPGQTVANGGNVLLYEGDVFENNLVFHLTGGGGAGAHVIIDITGYYVPIN